MGRRSPRTRTSTTCSRSSSLATAAWARPLSYSAMQTIPSRLLLSALWASTSRSRPSTATTRGSSCRSGTQQGKSGTGPSPQPTTGVPWALSSCMTLPMKNPSTLCRTGQPRSRPTHGTMPRCCWWATSVTWRMNGWCRRNVAGSWLTTLALSSLRQAPRTTLMSSRPLSAWWMSSVRRCPSHWTRPTLQSRVPSRAHSSRTSRRLHTRTAPAESCPAPPLPTPAHPLGLIQSLLAQGVRPLPHLSPSPLFIIVVIYLFIGDVPQGLGLPNYPVSHPVHMALSPLCCGVSWPCELTAHPPLKTPPFLKVTPINSYRF